MGAAGSPARRSRPASRQGSTVTPPGARPSCCAAQAITNHLQLSSCDPAGTLRFAPTCNLAARREIARPVPLRQPHTPAPAGEDRDWCARVVGAGHSIEYVPDAVVVHSPDLDLAGFVRQQYRYGRGAARFRARRAGAPARAAEVLRRAGARGVPGRQGRGLRGDRGAGGDRRRRGRPSGPRGRAADPPAGHAFVLGRPAASPAEQRLAGQAGGVRAGERADGRRDVDEARRSRSARGARAEPGTRIAQASPGVWLPERPEPAPRRRTVPKRSERSTAAPVAGARRPADHEVGQPVGVLAGVVVGGCGRRTRPPAPPSASRSSRGQRRSRRGAPSASRGVDDPVALATGEVEPHVALVVGRDGRRPGSASQSRPRSSSRAVSCERDPVGERVRERGPQPPGGTAARRRQIAPPSPASSGPPASTAASISGSRSARLVFTSIPTAEVTITSAPTGSAASTRAIARSTAT